VVGADEDACSRAKVHTDHVIPMALARLHAGKRGWHCRLWTCQHAGAEAGVDGGGVTV
jgi:hypothetical protein